MGERSRAKSEDRAENEALPASVECPFCGGEETEQFAAFGSAVSTSQYYCRPCRTVFEYMKWRDEPPTSEEEES